ncbi:MAG TPA: hypothetical protein VGW75_10060 [Solirubrobacteraceae bacterium]|jgi:hypothetical protein|nr:hypothetical protein [Solirubrobacteraceae bacterium]
MTRIALLTALLLVLLVTPASGKELGRVAICGPAGCTDVTDRATETVVQGGPVSPAPAGAHESYVLRVTVMEGDREIDTFTMRWLPRAQMLRGADGVWMKAPGPTQHALERLSRGTEPFPARTWAAEGRADAAPAPGAPAGGGGAAARRSSPEEGAGGGGPSTALAIAAPAAAALGLAALVARRRRRRS